MESLEKKLLELLESNQGERTIHNFLKHHNELIIHAFNRAWNYRLCVPEFKLGSDFRSDFLILSAHSGWWHAIFIELKDFNSKLYNKDETPSAALRKAQQQVTDWDNWIKSNENYAKKELSKILKRHKAPAIVHSNSPSYRTGYPSGAAEISDPDTYVSYHFHIVIGRSSSLSREERTRRAKDHNTWGGPEIATYDRFLHFAKMLDEAKSIKSNKL